MPPIIRAVRRSGIPTWVYRVLIGVIVTYGGWSSNQIYQGLQNGSTASAQTAERAVTVAVAAKTSIAAVQTTVAAISQRQSDAESVQAHIATQVDKLTGDDSAQSAQLSAISAKLDDLTSRAKMASLPF